MEANSIKQIANNTKIVKLSELYVNDYNPNRMPDAEMSLLKESILKYGFIFPIVATWDEDKKKYRIIDGYHRYETLKRIGANEATIVDMKLTYHDAVQLTVLMNRIKGLHQVELMSDLIVKLEDLGLEDSEICDNLGMESEEYLRLKQQLGIAHAFRNHEYSSSWDIDK